MTVKDMDPTLFDYFAGAILTNSISALAIYLAAYLPSPFEYVLIPIWCIAAGISAYFVCKRTTRNHRRVALITAIFSINLSIVMIPILKSLDIGLLIFTFVCFLIGSIGGAYIAERKQLNKSKIIKPILSSTES
jgi:hypothetical protein